MNSVTLVGLLAGLLTTIAFLPQVIKIWETKSVCDISFGTFALFSLGVSLWLVYGILQRDIPIMLANGLTLVLSLNILVFKVKYH